MSSFPLPRAPQEFYTKYYNKILKKGVFTNYKIVWVGQPLPCRFRSDTVKTILAPQHVFILQKKNEFEYGLVDNSDTVYKLPKKYFTSCFPNIQLSSVPENNLMEVKITRKIITLPYIPESFLEQKKAKGNRKRRRMYTNNDGNSYQGTEQIDFERNFPSWHVLENEQNRNSLIKREILHLIRYLIHYTDESDFKLLDPFENLKSIDDLRNDKQSITKLKIVLGFIYHYCRGELGLSFINKEYPKNVKEFLANLSSS